MAAGNTSVLMERVGFQNLDDSEETMDSLDVECAICLQILIEPVGPLPCHHEFCLSCFEQLVSRSASYPDCPICRAPTASWARRAEARGRLVNQARWEFIQKRFPNRVQRRLNNLDSDSDDEDASKQNQTIDLTGDDVEEAAATVRKRKRTSVVGTRSRRGAKRDHDGRVTSKEEQETNDYRYALRLHKKMNKRQQSAASGAAHRRRGRPQK